MARLQTLPLLVWALLAVARASIVFDSETQPVLGDVANTRWNVPNRAIIDDEVQNGLPTSQRIVNGDRVKKFTKLPFAVALLGRKNGKYYFLCSAVLVAKDIVLTAAHCTERTDVEFVACCGTSNLNKLGKEGGCSVVQDVRVPKKYESFISGYDIAILQTKSDLRLTGAEIAKVSLDSAFSVFGNGSPVDGVALGFGSTNVYGTNMDGRLRSTDMSIFDKVYQNAPFSQRHVVAAFTESGEGICNGDSGGPLIRSIGNGSRKKVVVGIASFVFNAAGGACDLLKPAMFSSLANANHARFLKMHVAQLDRHLKLFNFAAESTPLPDATGSTPLPDATGDPMFDDEQDTPTTTPSISPSPTAMPTVTPSITPSPTPEFVETPTATQPPVPTP